MSAILSLDEKIFLGINGIAGKVPILDGFMSVMVDDYFVFASLALILLALWFGAQGSAQREIDQKMVLCTVAGVGIACLVVHLITVFGPDRIRPYEALSGVHLLTYMRTDPSFPCEAAAVAFAMATGIWLSKRRIGAFMFLLAALLGFARVYCGVQYPLDVVGGALIGILSSYAMFKLFPHVEPVPTVILRWARRFYLA